MASHQFAKFGGHRHCGRRDIIMLILYMYLLAKLGDHRSYRNRNINSYTSSYMATLERAELTAFIRHIAIFLKSRIPIYNSEVPDTTG